MKESNIDPGSISELGVTRESRIIYRHNPLCALLYHPVTESLVTDRSVLHTRVRSFDRMACLSAT